MSHAQVCSRQRALPSPSLAAGALGAAGDPAGQPGSQRQLTLKASTLLTKIGSGGKGRKYAQKIIVVLCVKMFEDFPHV